jgi:hypothetical protein
MSPKKQLSVFVRVCLWQKIKGENYADSESNNQDGRRDGNR